ncbi:hypothetical protein DERF_007375, partial [Dermatophagoides farinae]
SLSLYIHTTSAQTISSFRIRIFLFVDFSLVIRCLLALLTELLVYVDSDGIPISLGCMWCGIIWVFWSYHTNNLHHHIEHLDV